jgi:hypothetical protein
MSGGNRLDYDAPALPPKSGSPAAKWVFITLMCVFRVAAVLIFYFIDCVQSLGPTGP